MNINSARVWKNSLYRTTSTNEELTQLPENPIGTLELTDEDLVTVAGACGGCNDGFNSFGDGGFGFNGFSDGGFAFRRRVYGFSNFGDGGCGDGGFGLGGIGLGGHIILGGGCQ